MKAWGEIHQVLTLLSLSMTSFPKKKKIIIVEKTMIVERGESHPRVFSFLCLFVPSSMNLNNEFYNFCYLGSSKN